MYIEYLYIEIIGGRCIVYRVKRDKRREMCIEYREIIDGRCIYSIGR